MGIRRMDGRGACIFFALLLAFGASESAASQKKDAQADRDVEAIRALIELTEAANNSGDAEAWVALFAEGAVYMPPGQPAVTSRSGLLAIAEAGFSSWRTEVNLTPDEIVVAGTWAFARISVAGKATPVGGGEAIAVDLKELAVFHRQPDGDWKIARLIANSNGS